MAELLLRKPIRIPLGSFVTVRYTSETQLFSFLALISKVVRPTRGVVSFPNSKFAVMLPPFPVGAPPNTRVLDSLKLVGAPDKVAIRIARVLGLDPELDCDRLAPGQMQSLALGRALLRDPEILVLAAPFAYLDKEMRIRISKLLRVWQVYGSAYVVSQLTELELGATDKKDVPGRTWEGGWMEHHDQVRRTLVIPDAGYREILELDQPDDVLIQLDNAVGESADDAINLKTSKAGIQASDDACRLPESRHRGENILPPTVAQPMCHPFSAHAPSIPFEANAVPPPTPLPPTLGKFSHLQLLS